MVAETDRIAALSEAPDAQTRRRGEALERAIFTAVLDQLCTVGYPGVTMEGIAACAHTGKAALYRRWASKEDLIVDALEHVLPSMADLPDHGNLRDDMLDVLRRLTSIINSPPRSARPWWRSGSWPRARRCPIPIWSRSSTTWSSRWCAHSRHRTYGGRPAGSAWSAPGLGPRRPALGCGSSGTPARPRPRPARPRSRPPSGSRRRTPPGPARLPLRCRPPPAGSRPPAARLPARPCC